MRPRSSRGRRCRGHEPTQMPAGSSAASTAYQHPPARVTRLRGSPDGAREPQGRVTLSRAALRPANTDAREHLDEATQSGFLWILEDFTWEHCTVKMYPHI